MRVRRSRWRRGRSRGRACTVWRKRRLGVGKRKDWQRNLRGMRRSGPVKGQRGAHIVQGARGGVQVFIVRICNIVKLSGLCRSRVLRHWREGGGGWLKRSCTKLRPCLQITTKYTRCQKSIYIFLLPI